ncbi:porin family protein [Echinicola sp. 20G]|uniref:porin family protein n=1 Tax=Echinicola sp. 20G TaxID=2781961 RepID=UPI00191103A7|nr:porin family protein [Echinicola sp. 20G]
MKRLIIILLVFVLPISLFAQESKTTNPIQGRPDIKGDLFLDLGFNILNNRPEDLSTKFFASKTANIYFQRPINLGEKSGWTLNPGIGLGLDKLAFKDNMTLINDPDKGTNSSQLVDIDDVYGEGISVDKNTMALNYVDIPVEIRYHFNKSDYNEGFRIALGGKVGMLYEAHTKIKLTDSDGVNRKIKDSQEFGLNKFRYGVYTRVGLSGFNLWAYYGLNDVFKSGQGPYETESTQFNFGMSVALF